MSKIITIPGGTATIAEGPHEITERRMRPIKSLASLYGAKIDAIMALTALAVEVEEGETPEPPDLSGFTPEDIDHLWEMQSATTWAYLLDWTLDRPLPATWRDMGDLPAALTQALDREVSKVAAVRLFTLDAVEDEASPTGASGD